MQNKTFRHFGGITESAKSDDLANFLNQTADEWLRMNGYSPKLVREIKISTNLCFCDKNLGQSITNILNNAFEASRSRDSSEVILRAIENIDDFKIDIEDFGHGFDFKNIAKIGTPFNTTKAENGHGLGLFLVANTLKYLGGKLEVKNKDIGTGAIVQITIPKAAIKV